jgi:aryl-alcohol dehydrogenase-like predicted oxidoreductase
MAHRRLGAHGPEVSAIGLGCFALAGPYGPVGDDEAIATIRRAVDVGITLLDTADVYGDGHAEELVGRAIQGRRDNVLVATKFGNSRPGQTNMSGSSLPASVNDRRIYGDAAYVHEACEASLRRLGVETIDLYQQHRVDPATPIEETVGAIAELVQEGKVRWIGLSEARPEDIRRASAVHPIASLQSEYSLFERTVEEDAVLETCEELGIGFLAFCPLARGILSGGYTTDTVEEGDVRPRGALPRFAGEHRAANAALAESVQEIAQRHDATPAQVALAWVLARKLWIVPIPGTRRAAHVEDNAGAPALELPPEDVTILEGLADRVAGERYGSAGLYATWVSPPLVRE